MLLQKRLSQKLRQEARNYQHNQADNQYGNGLLGCALPLFEDDAPNIGEGNIESHQDAKGQGVHGAACFEEAASQ